jgi:Na+/H+ antiporter NhaD/arsenite permease-like protein
MLRLVLQEIFLFSLPFLAFAGWLLFARRSPLDHAEWKPHWTRLILAGLFIVIASLVAVGLLGQRTHDGYELPRFENGQLVPGHFR